MSSLRICYQTIEFGDVDIHLRTLRNKQEFLDADGIAEQLGISSAQWSMFGVIWPSSKVLAHLMSDYAIEGKRILEVGCGIGLTSLVLNQRNADISATDYHPEAEGFLQHNVKLNKESPIPFLRTGWGDAMTDLGEFDLILGSDLLYEEEHAEALSKFINQHTKPDCEVIIVDPGRGHHARFSKKMVLLGYSHTQTKPIETDYLSDAFKGQILRYARQTTNNE